MSPERPGFLGRILKPIADFADFFAMREKPPTTRFVKTTTGMIVELGEDLPDALAEAMAQAMKTNKTISGYFDKRTGTTVLEK